jgi:hypothetical protein
MKTRDPNPESREKKESFTGKLKKALLFGLGVLLGLNTISLFSKLFAAGAEQSPEVS